MPEEENYSVLCFKADHCCAFLLFHIRKLNKLMTKKYIYFPRFNF